MRRPLLACACALATIGAPAAAARMHSVEAVLYQVPKYEVQYRAAYDKAADKAGPAAVGRNIVLDGYREHTGQVRLPKRSEVVESTKRLVSIANPPPAPSATYTTTPSVGTYTGGSYSIPEDIVMCESGGDYTAVNSTSGAGGAYQILPSTWEAYGGTGAPQDAPPEVQDAIAAQIWADSGEGAWVC